MSKSIFGNLKCPECGHEQKMKIPEGKCQSFYECSKCNKIIKAKESCCVFCDYGDKKCPISKKYHGVRK